MKTESQISLEERAYAAVQEVMARLQVELGRRPTGSEVAAELCVMARKQDEN